MTVTQKLIEVSDLVCMDDYEKTRPVRIDLVYAHADHPENIFQCAIYRKNAALFLYKDFAEIVFKAADIIHDRTGDQLVLKDGLRTVEAQQAMQETEIVKAHPEWSAEGPSRLLSPPGKGGHPRGMAVDVTIAALDGTEWDMGTSFDHLTIDPTVNPAARDYKDFPEQVLKNRAVLEEAFLQAGAIYGRKVLPLPAEWWDFRFPSDYSEQYAPISDADLPPEMRMTDRS